MKLYWNFVEGGPCQTYVATKEDLPMGRRVEMRTSVAWVERIASGSWSAFSGPSAKFIGNAKSKELAMELVGRSIGMD